MPRCFQHGAILFSILLFGFKIVSSLPWTSTTCDYENILGVCVPCTLEKRNGYLFRKLDKGIAPERPKSVKIRAFGRNKTTDGSKVEGFAVIIEHPNDKGLLNGYLISIKRTREVLSGEAVTVNKKDFLVQLTELQRKDLPLKVSFIIKKVQSLKASVFFGMISIAILYRPGSRLFPFKTSLNLHMKVNVLHEVIFNG